jgi:hypothetical protein
MNVIKYRAPFNTNAQVYKKPAIIFFIDILNKTLPVKERIVYKKTDSIVNLHKLLNDKMEMYKAKNKEYFWCGIISSLTNNNAVKQKIRRIDVTTLRPEMPKEWLKNKTEWLTNYDIDNVMIQYSNDKKYKYKFLGVFPIDFAVEINGKCLYSSVCGIDIKDYIKNDIKYIGFINNLDKHDESGSHWTSTFIILDPDNINYGAHYYDSTVKKIPKYIKIFIDRIKKQCNELYPKKVFKITSNDKKHQYKNTECGVFSMVYQIRWINFLLHDKEFYKKKDAYKIIVNDKDIIDDTMVRKRSDLFRPNIVSLKIPQRQ